MGAQARGQAMTHVPSETTADTAPVEPPSRRDLLYLATGSVVAVGAAITIWPFIDLMNPDAATIAAAGPVDIDVSQIQEGQRVVTLWAARPVFVVRRSSEALNSCKTPSFCRNCATRIPTTGSSRNTPKTGTARSS